MPSAVQGKIDFENVSLTYASRPETQVISVSFTLCFVLNAYFSEEMILFQNLSFSVFPGEVVALVGPSGAGKSSCISLLERFYEPTQGNILLDGVSISDYSHKYLHTKVRTFHFFKIFSEMFFCSVRLTSVVL